MIGAKKNIFVAMSGGVDSSVAALLLKRAGHNVTGVFMQGWRAPGAKCSWEEDRQDAARVAATLDIPFQVLDVGEQYRAHVVEYLVSEYARGRTPNPDVMCNTHIKFGVFYEWARERGADTIATGHYARTQIVDGKTLLATCRDTAKDQTYFLWGLTPEILAHVEFPIGDFTKPEVRHIADEAGLVTATKPDSQGVCFVGELDMKTFLEQYIPRREGAVVTTSGERVGTHDGAAYYTIGQRHGLGIGGGTPYFVVEKNMNTNTLVVAPATSPEQRESDGVRVGAIQWYGDEVVLSSGELYARIRYRQPLVRAYIYAGDKHMVRFASPLTKPSPGQSCVIYARQTDGTHIVVGGGIIEETL